MDEVSAVLGSPYTWLGIGSAAVVGVWWWSMTPTTANLTLVIGVMAFAAATFVHPWIGRQPVLVRLLWALAVFAVTSLGVYYTLWQSRASSAPQSSTAGMPQFDGEHGFAYIRPQQAEPPDGRVRLAIWNRGKQALSGVRVRMFETDPDLFPPAEPVELQVGTLPAGHIERTTLSIVPFNGKSFRMYRFEIISESVSVEQDLLFRYNERLKSLDDMTTVTHLPPRIVDGRLQTLLHQDWHEWTPPPTTTQDELSVLVQCQPSPIPTLVPRGTDVWMALATQSGPVIAVNLLPTPVPDRTRDTVITWNERGSDSFSMTGALCKITNNYSKPLLELKFLVNAKFQEVFKSGAEFKAGKLLEHDFTIRIPRLETSVPFVFYFVNDSQSVLTFKVLKDDGAVVAGESGRRPVRLVYDAEEAFEIRLSAKNAKLIPPVAFIDAQGVAHGPTK